MVLVSVAGAAAGQNKYVNGPVTVYAPAYAQSTPNERYYLNDAYHSDNLMDSAIDRASDGAILAELYSTSNPVRVTIITPSYNTYGACHPYPNTSGTVIHSVTCLANW